jgi:hypothetical protein
MLNLFFSQNKLRCKVFKYLHLRQRDFREVMTNYLLYGTP